MHKEAAVVLRMAKYPIKPHIGRRVYLLAFNYDSEDMPMNAEVWGFRNEKICIDDDNAEIYEMSKEDLAQLVSAGLIKCS